MERASVLWRTDEGRVRVFWRVLGFFGLMVVIVVLAGVFLPTGLIAASTAVLVGSVLSGWWWLRVDGRGPGALGFHASTRALPELVAGVGLGVGVAAVVVALMALGGGVRWVAQDGTAGAWLVGAAGSLAFFLVPAAAEEAVLRGYPLQALSEVWGRGQALLVTSIAFGLLHLGNPDVTRLALANVAAAGLLLGVIYLRTASLWWATGAHLGWNWAHGYGADVPVSGLEVTDAPLYEGVTLGPPWLGGGGFGPEGSLITTVVVLAASGLLWWGPWLRPGAAARAAEPLVPLPAEQET